MAANPDRWAIVGGGILGMTLAHRLAQAGRRVVLLESADRPGGLASAWEIGDVTWDRHYHVTLLSDRHLRGLLDELGLGDELQWTRTRTGFYVDGRLYSLSNSLEFLRFPPLGLWDKLRLALTIAYAARVRNWEPLEQRTAVEWLRRWSGERTLARIWLPLLRAKLGERAHDVSAAFIWAVIARMYAARRTGLKHEMFGYVRGGYARVLSRFAERLVDEGVEVRLNAPVRQVVCEGGHVRIGTAAGEEDFDRVVLTVPGPTAARLCPALAEAEAAAWRSIEYQGIVCASVLLRRPLAGYYVTNITDAWVPFTAVIEMSALVDRGAFGGNSLIYLPKYVAPDDPFFDVVDADVQSRFLSALERMYPDFRRNDVVAFRVSRVRQVFALPTLGYSGRLPPLHSTAPGLYVVNSARIVNGTLNVNETVALADRVAPELLAAAPAAQEPASAAGATA